MIREEPQYYFKCSSCRWFGPLTKEELARIRVGELGTSNCPKCGQVGFVDPTPPRRTTSLTTWLVVGAVATIGALVAVFNL